MKKVSILGLGKMGSAILSSLRQSYEVNGFDQGDDLSQVAQSDVVILAVKPQDFPDLCAQVESYMKDQIVLSIMAGVTTKNIAEGLDVKKIVRCMPNLALAKSKSITGAYSTDRDQPEQLGELLGLWGQVVWLEKESDFDGFTALAGSGPAYFLELVNQLQVAAERLGFDSGAARQIADHTLVSAAALIDDQSAAEKIKAIASKGGTTEAALSVLNEAGFGSLISRAVDAAAARSRELSQ